MAKRVMVKQVKEVASDEQECVALNPSEFVFVDRVKYPHHFRFTDPLRLEIHESGWLDGKKMVMATSTDDEEHIYTNAQGLKIRSPIRVVYTHVFLGDDDAIMFKLAWGGKQ